MIATVLGGIGLFLLGMLLMTEGLKAIAGKALNRVLARFTQRPVVGLLSGAVMTALVQSSSVTTLAMIGFVSAGLLTFPQTLGLILGTNLGTTSTGWIVSLIGFKFNVAAVALPLVAVGTFIRLSGEGKALNFGSALAGFGLIFVGIATMQEGMAELSATYDPSRFPGGNLAGNLLLVLIGVGMTVVMQSSSAAVATTLAALYASAINLEQAAVLVIGQNVGTTITAAIAAFGASIAARRVALAHILFNVITAVIAFALLPVLVRGMILLRDILFWNEATTVAAFHTTFNLLGVALFLPFTGPFARLVQRLLPDQGRGITLELNPKVIRIASAAIEAAHRATTDITKVLVEVAHGQLSGKMKQRAALEQIRSADLALAETRRFLAAVRPEQGETVDQQHHVSVFHAIDHLQQLSEALAEFEVAKNAPNAASCQAVCQDLVLTFAHLPDMLASGTLAEAAGLMEEKSLTIANVRRSQRREILEKTAALGLDPDTALDELEAMRWTDRLAYHIWRAAHHLALTENGPSSPPELGAGGLAKADKEKKKKKHKNKEKKAKEQAKVG